MQMISKISQETLIDLAKKAQEKSYSPYSNFSVGATILSETDQLYTACNVENISYGLTICAERSCVFKMVSEEGPQAKIKSIAITTKKDVFCGPCGACRQVIYEFSTPDTLVFYKTKNGFVSKKISEILPDAFLELP